jgi:hypothetical protein
MAYYLDLFSPETYEAFSRSDRSVSGFRKRQRNAAARIRPGDKLVCYMTKLSRWVGMLEVGEGPFEDGSPIFYPESDPFVIRFKVRPSIWLPSEKAIPIYDESIWNRLSFTRGQVRGTSTWTGKIRSSLVELDPSDGAILEEALKAQVDGGRVFEIDEDQYARYTTHRVRRADKDVTVTVPIEPSQQGESAEAISDMRESLRMQRMLAHIGDTMGMRIWIPRADRSAVISEWTGQQPALERLPLNYDESTLRTIEQIDVLWLKGRSIVRAFEVEHTTSIYSGILRMADLLALQPNMDISLHIVAPGERREKVFQEIRRPVFSFLDRGPLSESCTYLSYESVREIIALPKLAHTSPSVVDDYAESAEDAED